MPAEIFQTPVGVSSVGVGATKTAGSVFISPDKSTGEEYEMLISPSTAEEYALAKKIQSLEQEKCETAKQIKSRKQKIEALTKSRDNNTVSVNLMEDFTRDFEETKQKHAEEVKQMKQQMQELSVESVKQQEKISALYTKVRANCEIAVDANIQATNAVGVAKAAVDTAYGAVDIATVAKDSVIDVLGVVDTTRDLAVKANARAVRQEAELETLGSQVINLECDVGHIAEDLEHYEGRFDAVEDVAFNNAERSYKNAEAITKADGRLDVVETVAFHNAERSNENAERITEAEGKIEKLSWEMKELKCKISNIEGITDAFNMSIDDLTQDLAGISDEVSRL